MAAGWWRQTSDNKLVAAADSLDTVPADHDFVLASTIEAAYTGIIYQLGFWNGTTYTPPTDIITPFDPTAAGGDVQEAAHKAEDVFDNALELIDDNEMHGLMTRKQRARGYLLAARQHGKGLSECNAPSRRAYQVVRGMCVMADRHERECSEYVDAFETTIPLPTKDFSWVGPASPFTRVDVMQAATRFNSATNVEDAPKSDKLIGRAYINDIPA